MSSFFVLNVLINEPFDEHITAKSRFCDIITTTLATDSGSFLYLLMKWAFSQNDSHPFPPHIVFLGGGLMAHLIMIENCFLQLSWSINQILMSM